MDIKIHKYKCLHCAYIYRTLNKYSSCPVCKSSLKGNLEYNETIDCSRNSFITSNENSNNNSVYLSNNEIDKQDKKVYYYRGIQMKDKEEYDYDKDDSYIED